MDVIERPGAWQRRLRWLTPLVGGALAVAAALAGWWWTAAGLVAYAVLGAVPTLEPRTRARQAFNGLAALAGPAALFLVVWPWWLALAIAAPVAVILAVGEWRAGPRTFAPDPVTPPPGSRGRRGGRRGRAGPAR